MNRVRRYRQGWLLLPALLASAALQSGAVITYQATRPPVRPFLILHLEGEGDGQVLVTTPGVAEPLLRCAQPFCKVQLDRGTEIRLVALPGKDATFEGWRQLPARTPVVLQPWLGDPMAKCVADGLSADELVARSLAGDALECAARVERDLRVEVDFGVQPEEQELALLDTPTDLVADAAPPDKKKRKPDDPEQLDDVPLEVALPPPQDVVPPPPPPEQAAAQKPPPPTPANMTAVEVPDTNVVEKAPDDATHQSDKNRDVAEETRAAETNLEKELEGSSSPSKESPDTTSPDIGGPDEKIAQLEDSEATTSRAEESDRSGQADKAAGEIVGEAGDNGDGSTGDSPGLLSMRGIEGRGGLPDQANGKKAGKKGRPGVKTQLDIEDYERIVGKDKAQTERQVAARRMTTRRGRFEKKMAAIKSALENFTPDIRVGNQTALKTRANPFAVYIARMHRRIHELWGFGFLADLDSKPASHPLNNFDLFTVIEMSIDPDGTVHKTTIAKTSGKLEFDVAALDTVISSAPYEPTPEAIRSVDGRVYLRWGFYRNWRQCGTFNSEPYILSEIPGGVEPIDDGAMVRSVPGRGVKPVTPPSAQEEARPSPASSVKDDKALYAANLWVSGFSTADVDKLVRFSAVPFRASGVVAAENGRELREMYTGLLAESGPLKDWALLTGEEYAKRVGAPVELGEGSLILLVRTAKESFALVMARTKSGEFRVTQMRR